MTDEFPKLHDVTWTDELIDELYSTVDDAFTAGRFTDVDRYLDSLLVPNIDTTMLLGVLSVTLPARNELFERAPFYCRVRELLLRRDPDRVEALLQGLE